jgi:hypothetical protein
MSTAQFSAVESGNRIQLPADWMQALGLHGLVILERTCNGILIRPCPPVTWDELFATKLAIGSAPLGAEEGTEETPDDVLF